MNRITKNCNKDKIKKVKQACDECHKRRVKCKFDTNLQKCSSCLNLNVNCAFHRVPLKRGPYTGSRKETLTFNNIAQVPISPRNSINSVSSTSSRRNSSSVSIETNDIDMRQLIKMIDDFYIKRGNNDWIPIIPMTQRKFIDRFNKFNNNKVIKFFYETIKMINCNKDKYKYKTNEIMLNILSIEFDELNNDDIIIFFCSLIMLQVIKFNKILFGLTIGIFNDLKKKLQDEDKIIIVHRIELLLNIIDLLNSDASDKLCNFSILNYTEKYFTSDEFNLFFLLRLQFFENLREIRINPNYVIDFSKFSMIEKEQNLISQYMKLIIHKTKFINQLNEFEVIDKPQDIIVTKMRELLNEIKHILFRIVKEGSNDCFINAVLEETKKDVEAIKHLPTFALRNLMNNTTITGNETLILQVTQSMNDLVECSGLLGGLLSENRLASIPRTAAHSSVLDINNIINHDSNNNNNNTETLPLPIQVAQRLSNRCI